MNLGRDAAQIEKKRKEIGDVVLIVIYSLNAYMGSHTEIPMWRDADIRSAPVLLLHGR